MLGGSKASKEGGDKQPDDNERKKLPLKWPKEGPKSNKLGTGDPTGKSKDTRSLALRPGKAKPPGSGILATPSQPTSLLSLPARVQDRRSQDSQRSDLSTKGEFTRDPLGQPKYHRSPREPNENGEAYKELMKRIKEAYGQSRALMLEAGQGGTFRFGKSYVTEDGNKIFGDKLPTNFSNTKHLTFFGRSIDVIATTGCVSCTSVYFELTGNRFFAAHINTWHDDRTFYVPKMRPQTTEYNEIKKEVYDRLVKHSEEFGWSYKDVILETLKVHCPEPQAQAYAVLDVLKDFLQLEKRPPILQAHGFVIIPSESTRKGGPCGLPLFVEWKKEAGTLTQYIDKFPSSIVRLS